MPNLKYSFSDDVFSEFRSQQIIVKPISERWERDKYFSLRKEVFGLEQKIFENSDIDSADFRSTGIIALSSNFAMPDEVIGAVRIYLDDSDEGGKTWFGGRLCVASNYRRNRTFSLGTALINEAVSLAKDLGGERFLANIQPQNELFFQRLHWRSIRKVQIHGITHIHMEADLDRYPFMHRGGMTS
ncbi:MSMEG_0567/Sll0786 family nitrogen starvation N-acetyltransferase [Alcanivorax jadensis]|uniref:MSMEG_0567/Sll0786 family nitrogen starvation N-acetyltransferase n=1 Tax=Alcanivorax jadensis TaxID=64988 RepID=UPI00240A6C44|nr:MSMEG_0567/Sll0786 family nitrogen starvation N-acetyltransferase [Alcanivorax jadensis]MDF1639065.1 GNAT family N-acetyltransferase [Alcanivorax jadensis]